MSLSLIIFFSKCTHIAYCHGGHVTGGAFNFMFYNHVDCTSALYAVHTESEHDLKYSPEIFSDSLEISAFPRH